MSTEKREATVLNVRDAVKHYPVRRTSLRGPRRAVHALDGVTVELLAGQTLGVVGESGCGKSTWGRVLCGLTPADAGTVRVGAEQRPAGSRAAMGMVQAVFQDPAAALDPRMTIGESIAEALPGASHEETRCRVEQALEMVNLGAAFAQRLPTELSGGQQQRACIARAIIGEPEVILLDEAVASLDASLQAEAMALLVALQRRIGVAYVFISHDLRAVRQISDVVAVMYLGQIVELAPAGTFDRGLLHPYSVALRSTEPRLLGDADPVERIVLQGEPPSAINPGPGCRFAPRCPLADNKCRTTMPDLTTAEDGHQVRCFKPGEMRSQPPAQVGATA